MTSAINLTVEHIQDLKRARITAVSSGGWLVKICGPNVTVPEQDSAGKSIDDLAALLQAAYRTAGTPINCGIGSLGRVRASLPETLVSDLVAVLRSAQRIADEQWNRASRDVYRCLELAWRNTAMHVPHTLLIAAVRAALPPATTLCDFNSNANVHTIHALFDTAIAALKHGAATTHVA
jgi:hypothetical protein